MNTHVSQQHAQGNALLGLPGYLVFGAWRAFRQSLNWRIALVWMAAVLLPAVWIAYFAQRTWARELDHSVLAGALQSGVDVAVAAELMMRASEQGWSLSRSAWPALVLFFFTLPWLMGLVVDSARRSRPPRRFAELFKAGRTEYLRLLKLQLWGLALMALVGGIWSALNNWAVAYALKQVLEANATRVSWGIHAAGIAIFAVVLLSLDAARAQIVAEPWRRSAIAAWWCAVQGLAAHPRRIMLWLFVSALGLGAAAGLGVCRLQMKSWAQWDGLKVLVVTELLVLVLVLTRIARVRALAGTLKG